MKNLHEIRAFSDWQLAVAYSHSKYGIPVRFIGDKVYYYDNYYSTENRFGVGAGYLLFQEDEQSQIYRVKYWIDEGRPAYNPALLK